MIFIVNFILRKKFLVVSFNFEYFYKMILDFILYLMNLIFLIIFINFYLLFFM